MRVSRESRGQTLTVAAVLVLAAALRLFWLQYGEYQWDDERMWSAAVHAISSHILPLNGVQSTIGAPNGPLQIDLLIPFALFSAAPLSAAIGFALFNTAAVYFLYDLVASFFSRRAALIAALLFAVNSWALLFSRHLSQQGMMLPFQVLFFWNVARWLVRGRGLDLVLMFLWAAIMPQVYIDGLIHLGTLAAVLALGWRQIKLVPLVTGAALAAAVLLPYLIVGLLPALVFFRGYATTTATTDLQSVVYAIGQATHIGLQVVSSNMGQMLDTTSGAEAAFVALEVAAYIAGIGYGAYRLAQALRRGKPHESRLYGLFAIWLLLPVVVYLHHQEIVTWRHLMLTLPLPAVLTGLLLDRLWSLPAATATAALAGNAVVVAGVFLAVAPTCGANSGYGLPYQYTFDAADSIRQQALDQGAHSVFIDGYPAVAPTLTSILGREGLNAVWSDPAHGPELPVPARLEQSIYVTLQDDTDNGRLLQQAARSFQISEQDLPCVGATLHTYAVAPTDLLGVLKSQPTTPLDVRAANGLSLASVMVNRRLTSGDALRIGIAWRWTGGRRPASDYWLFAHLLDGGGRQVGQQDVPLPPADQWFRDESAISWLDVPVPAAATPGTYLLELGMYDRQSARTELTDVRGQTSSSIVIQPLVIPPRQAEPEPAFSSASARFGDEIELAGYSASDDGQISLSWRALRQPARDYTVFVHAVDASGRIVAQADGEPDAGQFPTSLWQPGESVLDTHKLSLTPGQYQVQVGVYYLPTGERLAGQPVTFDFTAT